MADRDKDIRLFFRAARRRLEAARLLLDNGFDLDAIYLGGYGVECSLKGLILRRTPRKLHAETFDQVTRVGAKAHDFEYLKDLLKLRLRRRGSPDQLVFGDAALIYRLSVTGCSRRNTEVVFAELIMKNGAKLKKRREKPNGWRRF